jgi:hypothetical protein
MVQDEHIIDFISRSLFHRDANAHWVSCSVKVEEISGGTPPRIGKVFSKRPKESRVVETVTVRDLQTTGWTAE